ncbi:MAG: branched-chain amino acid transport system permease protein [Thermomicrobiales bacterium]|jgi:branched-chain amino acid transport system permease protein|nr:branched-chain amino acid transport system permease protein [Thermomicrobiales bacterium]MEA2527518.1 branched-chain amino acid transport system permease protein [Thermomicrobiales bacterium]
MSTNSAAITAPQASYGDPIAERRAARRKFGVFALVFVVMFFYPFVDRALEINRLGSFMSIFVFVILAMGLNVVVGYAGLLDLGYAAFFAIGAYTIAFLTSPGSVFVQRGWIPEFFQQFWPAMALSWAVAAVFGVLLGAPTLRLRGDYLAIVTLGFGEIVPNFFYNAENVTNGTRGVNPIAKPRTLDIFGYDLAFGATAQRHWYWLMLLVGLLSVFLINRLYNSRLGRSWVAIREDEIAAASMGVNLVRTKLWAFALGASFSGFAGSVYAAAFQYVHPSQFDFSVSVMILAMVILGGLGNIYGVIFGGLLIASFDRILAEVLRDPLQSLGRTIGSDWLAKHDLTSDRLLVFGLALVLMMLLRPEGLLPSARRKRELHPEQDEIRVQETQQLFDIRQQNEPAVGERA